MYNTPIYNAKTINEMIPIEEMMNYLGCDTSRKGNGNVKCPSVEHTDNKPSAHIYKNSNTCVCFACVGKNGGNKSFTPLSLYRNHRGLESSSDFPVACAEVVELFNLPKEFVIENYNEVLNNGTKTTKESFPLTKRDLDFLGLKPNPTSVKQQVNIEEKYYVDYEENPDYHKDDEEFVQKNDLVKSFAGVFDKGNVGVNEYRDVIKTEHIPIYKKKEISSNGKTRKVDDTVIFSVQKLWKENKESFSYLIYGKIQEKLSNISLMASEENYDNVSKYFSEIDKLVEIKEKVENNTGFKYEDVVNTPFFDLKEQAKEIENELVIDELEIDLE